MYLCVHSTKTVGKEGGQETAVEILCTLLALRVLYTKTQEMLPVIRRVVLCCGPGKPSQIFHRNLQRSFWDGKTWSFPFQRVLQEC